MGWNKDLIIIKKEKKCYYAQVWHKYEGNIHLSMLNVLISATLELGACCRRFCRKLQPCLYGFISHDDHVHPTVTVTSTVCLNIRTYTRTNSSSLELARWAPPATSQNQMKLESTIKVIDNTHDPKLALQTATAYFLIREIPSSTIPVLTTHPALLKHPTNDQSSMNGLGGTQGLSKASEGLSLIYLCSYEIS